MDARHRIKHKLKTMVGLRHPPSDAQLDSIISAIERLATTRTPTHGDWAEITERLVPGAREVFYAGEDFSDLNYLLMLLQIARPSGSGGGGSSDNQSGNKK